MEHQREQGGMRFGLFGITVGPLGADLRAAITVAGLAEREGWESVWAAEHYVLPDPAGPDSPGPSRTPIADAWVALAAVAATTERIGIGTGVTVAPYHHPVALAKEAASLDRLSLGRFRLGLGVGYLRAEFDALGQPLAGRHGPARAGTAGSSIRPPPPRPPIRSGWSAGPC